MRRSKSATNQLSSAASSTEEPPLINVNDGPLFVDLPIAVRDVTGFRALNHLRNANIIIRHLHWKYISSAALRENRHGSVRRRESRETALRST